MRFPVISLEQRVFSKTPVEWPKVQWSGASRALQEYTNTKRKPFFNILTDNGIAILFLETVAANPEEALAFVSKNFVNEIDFDALRDILGSAETGQCFRSFVRVKALFGRAPKNCLTSSVLVVNQARNEKSILHVHMIKEPDAFGQWKIYNIERE